MKKNAARILCLVLSALILCAGIPAMAEGESVQTSWQDAAMQRAQADGYVVGGDSGLMPGAYVDRAQAAAIINRTLSADRTAELAGNTNVSPSSWYYADMQKAAYLGYLQSYSASVMTRRLTRGETFVILARAFSLERAQADGTSLAAFSDASALKGETLAAASSLAGDGIISGSGGRINSGAFVTRAEFIAMLYRIIDKYKLAGCDTGRAEIPADGFAVIRSNELSGLGNQGKCEIAAFAQASGDAALSAACGEAIVGTGGGRVTLSGAVKKLDVVGDGRKVTVSGSTDTAAVSADGAEITVGAGGRIGTLSILAPASGCSVVVNGTVDSLVVSGPGCTVTGTGRVGKAEINALDCSASVCPGGYSRLSQVGLSLAAPETLKAGEKLTVTAEVKCASSAPVCVSDWYVNGQAQTGAHSEALTLSDGTADSFSPEVKYAVHMADKMTVGFSLKYAQNGALEYKYVSALVGLENFPASHYYASEAARVINMVATYQYPTTVTASCTIYKDSSLKTRQCWVGYGTKATCVSSIGNSVVEIKLANGTLGWTYYGNIARAVGNCTRKEDYSKEDKEVWVNAKKYTSSTDYLVWVSLGCQRVNVFKKTAAGWELYKVFACASGRNQTQTPTGMYQLSYHQTRWDYGTYWCGPVTGFYGGYAFHSWLNLAGGGAYDHTMGQPASHGCIRMEDAGARFMYTLPMGTRVVVF